MPNNEAPPNRHERRAAAAGHSPAIPLPLWVRPREAARLLGCGLTFMYDLIAAERVVSRKMRLISTESLLRIGE